MNDCVTNLLFVCSKNQWRSPTAEAIWRKDPRVNARSAGTSAKAKRTASERDILWADVIFVMEKRHQTRLKMMFPDALAGKNLYILDIEDIYGYMDEELVEMIHQSVSGIMGFQ